MRQIPTAYRVVPPAVVERIRHQGRGAAKDARRRLVHLVVLDIEADVEEATRAPLGQVSFGRAGSGE